MTVTIDTTPATPAVASELVTAAKKNPPSNNAEPTKFRMVALDLDGTLLNSQHQLSEATKACLRRLDKQGFIVSIATGRAICTVYDTVKSLNLPKPIPVVCSNGAEGFLCSVVDDTIEKEQLFSTPVPPLVAQKTVDLATDMGFLSQYYVGDEVFADPREPYHFKVTEAYIKLTGSKTQYITDRFQKAIQKGPPSKQLVLCKVEEQDKMIHAFETELAKEPYLINGKQATIVRGNLGWFLEVLHPDVCKGNGLKKMCDHLEVPLKECVAFGDGDNDYEFLQMAGKGVAMQNARDIIKKIADEVIQYNNDEDGVAKTLQTLEKQGNLVFASS